MPRLKLYRSAAKRRAAEREKSQRYYRKCQEKILLHKKETRNAKEYACSQLFNHSHMNITILDFRIAVRKALKDARERLESEEHERNLVAADNRPYSSTDPLHNMRKVENTLNKSTARLAKMSQYFDSLVGRLLRWDTADPLTRNPVSPLGKAFHVFRPLQKNSEVFTEKIFQEKGAIKEYDHALRVCMRLNKIVDGLEELKRATMDGTLASKHGEGVLLCQHQLWRAGVDGITGLAVWSYHS
ncbi:hypothetical protein VNI00_017355 [Paramarasmius palmivorus]|uniref:Uncharacterized protein n=1 Tax=Paramarasmius palmivorus TaxID=297713 RepID=A0AAW0B8J4_9AGAR